MKKLDYIYIVLIVIISFILVSDLFINRGTPATFDGPVHIANIAMFYRGLREGEIRPTWGDGFANYGMPMPLIVQQTTSYLGGLLTFVTHDVVTSYHLVYFIGAALSCLFLYIFLRRYFSPLPSLAGVFLFNFAPYRIINIYIRGAMPEFFACVFLPVILLGIYELIEKRNKYGLLFITLATAGIMLTHPFTFIIYSFIFIPYLCVLLYKNKRGWRLGFWVFLSVVIGIGLAAYYLVPLFLEIKYFYYGSVKNPFAPNHFLGLENYLDPNWYYYYKNDTYTRGHFMQAGLLETMVLMSGIVYSLGQLVQKKKINRLIVALIISSPIIIFFTSRFSEFFYTNINLLGNIQHPWRMLSIFVIVAPIFLSFLIEGRSKWIVIPIMLLVIWTRFPQLYGKNYVVYPQKYYFYTVENWHGSILNTIWTSNTADYPVKKFKGEIVEGKGKIVGSTVKNSSREYTVKADTDIRMVDYTFYFPGWRVYVDGKKTDIQFQDPAYRGVITYNVPKGEHIVSLKFGDTAVRLAAKISSLVFVGLFILLCKKINLLPDAYNKKGYKAVFTSKM